MASRAWDDDTVYRYTIALAEWPVYPARLDPDLPAEEHRELLRRNTSRSLARIGLDWQLPADWSQVEWFGAGPGEAYPDSRQAVRVGRFHTTVEQMQTPYVRPQDNGNRADVRWAEVSDGSGAIHVRGEELFHLSARRWTDRQLDAARHQTELPPRPARAPAHRPRRPGRRERRMRTRRPAPAPPRTRHRRLHPQPHAPPSPMTPEPVRPRGRTGPAVPGHPIRTPQHRARTGDRRQAHLLRSTAPPRQRTHQIGTLPKPPQPPHGILRAAHRRATEPGQWLRE
ncbi:beta-galactosidase small subunit-related protein [Streptomyces venezuelae]|uniref:hypothetical protein n=1 Tax=Streptomyces venezuelae TaxID=54571 RepID=UPI0037D4AE0A